MSFVVIRGQILSLNKFRRLLCFSYEVLPDDSRSSSSTVADCYFKRAHLEILGSHPLTRRQNRHGQRITCKGSFYRGRRYATPDHSPTQRIKMLIFFQDRFADLKAIEGMVFSRSFPQLGEAYLDGSIFCHSHTYYTER